jgi:hypothetical protein
MRTAPTLSTSSAYNSDSGNATSVTSGGTQNGMVLIESASTGAGVRGGTDSVSGSLKGRAHFRFGVIIMINTVEKIYNRLDNEFVIFIKLLMVNGTSIICTSRSSKHRLPSNTRVDSRRWYCYR